MPKIKANYCFSIVFFCPGTACKCKCDEVWGLRKSCPRHNEIQIGFKAVLQKIANLWNFKLESDENHD